ncbi:hypothetical protein A6C57_23535 [Fibrella sp. ES10-3-2-2]|nr:hypothetical protein A6C57_23535 [Fibrella sp. ES10-3-2-2]
MNNNSHKELVSVAYRWVLSRTFCGVAFKELYTSASNGEYPDVIGFGSWGNSVLIEVKISRSDFLADRKKLFRQHPDMGMGRYRFYCCPTGLLKPEDLPEKWGLIYVNEAGRAKCVYNPYNGNRDHYSNVWDNGFEQNMRAEHGFMYSALRRLHKRGLTDAVYLPEATAFAPPECIPDFPDNILPTPQS